MLKEKISEIRSDINSSKNKLKDLDILIDTEMLKYANGKLGFESLKQRTNKALNQKANINETIQSHIENLEKRESEIEGNKNT